VAGLVSLVGAGPGDPGLLTLKGLARLREAEVVVYDRLVPQAILLEASGGRLVNVGKAPGQAAMSQEDISRLLVEEGRAGRRVVRLKGGDPFLFGRGGEEAQALAEAGVPFEIVPGVTSAIAAPAYAGIPVTHRGLSTHVTFVTGHEDPEKGESQTDWERLAASGGTLCILMGVGQLARIVERLLAAGRMPDEAAAAITWGTTARQQVIRSSLAKLPTEPVEAPAVVVIGPVAALADHLEWFARPPLGGRRIIVTRAREKVSRLRADLEALGAVVVEMPSIAFEEPSDREWLRRAVCHLGSGHVDWVIFTSATGVERTMAVLHAEGLDARSLARTQIAAIGAGTSATLRSAGIVADLVPDEFIAESLAAAMPRGPGRVVLLRAEEARETLPQALRDKGWAVEVVPVYRTVLGSGGPAGRSALERGEIDAVTFTASSTVRNFVALVGDVPRPPVIACIGPITAATAAELGWPATVVADEHTIEGLVRALVSAFER
jgi:uroporphyrinogen III methyltransferase / synthase